MCIQEDSNFETHVSFPQKIFYSKRSKKSKITSEKNFYILKTQIEFQFLTQLLHSLATFNILFYIFLFLS
jgi:hypothetical protein